MKREITLVSASALFMLGGCATAPQGAKTVNNPADLPSIQQQEAPLLSNLKIGMSLADFKKHVPSAYMVGQNNQTTAYALVDIQKYVTSKDIRRQNFYWGLGSPSARSRKQVLWFYFYDGKLVKWGRPQDWPEHPDKIIEIRNR